MRLLDLMGSVTEFLGLAVVCLQVLFFSLQPTVESHTGGYCMIPSDKLTLVWKIANC